MYNRTVLKSGVRILSERLEHLRSVSLGIWVNVGSRDETEKENGLSHFIEHMVFKGTENRSSLQIAKELDAIGGLSNAFTGKEYTCFHSKVLDKHFPTMAEILADIILHSTFDEQDIERERQVILQEINMVEDTPEDHIHELFNRLFWTDHPLGMSVLGTEESVSAVKRKTILQYIKRFYTPDRIILTAAGNIDHEALVAYFRPLFEPLKPAREDPQRALPVTRGGVSCNHKRLEQVQICLGGEGPHLSSDLRYAGAILNTILGGNMSSRLFQEIREKRGLAYAVYSFLSAYIDTGLMGVYVATDPAAVNRVLRLVNKQVTGICRGEVSRSDLDNAREHLIGGILLGAESPDSRMMRLAKNEYVFGKHVSYDELVADLERVEVDDVVAVARKTFDGDRVSLATLGPVREEDLDLDSLRFHEG
jgi:predicted Zn-dependent peptidase